MSHVPWGFCPPRGLAEIEVGKSRESKVPAGSEIEEAKEGPADRGAHVGPGTCRKLPLDSASKVKLSKR